jgi:hypothetical protein
MSVGKENKAKRDRNRLLAEAKAEQAKRDKSTALFNIFMSTGVAVMRAWELGPIVGPIMAAITAGIGAAQFAAVAARPIPLARGGYAKKRPGGVLAQIAEGDQDEIVMPMKTGISEFVNGFVDKIQSMGFPQMPVSGSGAGSSLLPAAAQAGAVHWHIGTLIADEKGIKELERRQSHYRISERQRKGGQ